MVVCGGLGGAVPAPNGPGRPGSHPSRPPQFGGPTPRSGSAWWVSGSSRGCGRTSPAFLGSRSTRGKGAYACAPGCRWGCPPGVCRWMLAAPTGPARLVGGSVSETEPTPALQGTPWRLQGRTRASPGPCQPCQRAPTFPCEPERTTADRAACTPARRPGSAPGPRCVRAAGRRVRGARVSTTRNLQHKGRASLYCYARGAKSNDAHENGVRCQTLATGRRVCESDTLRLVGDRSGPASESRTPHEFPGPLVALLPESVKWIRAGAPVPPVRGSVDGCPAPVTPCCRRGAGLRGRSAPCRARGAIGSIQCRPRAPPVPSRVLRCRATRRSRGSR
jgi:hypothetical protein